MDLSPFLRINPCGYAGLEMTQVSQLGGPAAIEQLESPLIEQILTLLDYDQVTHDSALGKIPL